MGVDFEALGSELGSVTDQWRELDPHTDRELSVDGVLPRLWCEPSSPEELGEILKLASSTGASVIPRGGGSRMSLGMPPRTADILLSTRRLSRVVEYEPADLTVTVESGLSFSELQQQLTAEGQFLALDPPCGAGATIGGVVAANASGPLRLQYGAARDLVIGTRVANADGILTRAGGRVVKNVAGYDLNKLYTGSLGTLGVLVELSFKLHPRPRSTGTLVGIFDHARDAGEVVSAVMRSPLGPAALEVLDQAAAARVGGLPDVPDDGCALLVMVGGFEKAVTRVLDDIGVLCRASRGRADVVPEQSAQTVWDAVRNLPASEPTGRVVLKMALPPARSIDGYLRLRSALESFGASSARCARAGVGIVYATVDNVEWDEARLTEFAATMKELRAFSSDQQGSLVVESAPVGLKERVDVWGEIGPALRLMRALKDRLDPANTLNPGRFVGGI